MTDDVLGQCELFEEVQVGGERYESLVDPLDQASLRVWCPCFAAVTTFYLCRYNFFRGCPKAKTCTIILRGGAEQFTEETERSLHDAIMIVRRAIKVSLLFVCVCVFSRCE